MKRFANDVANAQIFYFIIGMCIHALSPGVFASIFIYLYMLTHIT